MELYQIEDTYLAIVLVNTKYLENTPIKPQFFKRELNQRIFKAALEIYEKRKM